MTRFLIVCFFLFLRAGSFANFRNIDSDLEDNNKSRVQIRIKEDSPTKSSNSIRVNKAKQRQRKESLPTTTRSTEELKKNLETILPRAWSLPQVNAKIRLNLTPPYLQHAVIDDVLYQIDVMRNVATKKRLGDKESSTLR